jgi:hypothetical protein
MSNMRKNVVTLKSLLPAPGSATESSVQSGPAGQKELTAEDRLRLARYQQIVRRVRQETKAVGDDVMVTVPDREVSLAQSKLAEENEAQRALAAGGQEVKFGTGAQGGDIWGWFKSLFDHVDQSQAHAMVRPADTSVETLPDDAIVAIAADWGTGMYGAPDIADAIRKQSATRKFDLLMHLGDVYYSGTHKEVQERFLDVWPAEAGAISRTLNSNHEMYSGGFAYFDLALPALKQKSSYFALQNKHWLLIGLDTAYVDHDMDTQQVAWVNTVIEQGQKDGPRKVVFFSHQQPFSQLGNQGPKLQLALQHLLEGRKIKAWYFGHEHVCAIYDRHPGWELHGRCLGNGGIPEPRDSRVTGAADDPTHATGVANTVWKRVTVTSESPGAIVLDGPNMTMDKAKDQQKFSPHGFMTLEFKGDKLIEKVFLSDGSKVYEETLS